MVALPSLGISNDFDLTVECAFTTAPYATASWTDITEYVRSFATRRGRSSDRDSVQPGIARARVETVNEKATFRDPRCGGRCASSELRREPNRSARAS